MSRETRSAVSGTCRGSADYNLTQCPSAVALIPLSEAILTAAQTALPAAVSTLDAIHLATALELAGDGLLEAIMTYDVRLAQAAGTHGLAVLAPR